MSHHETRNTTTALILLTGITIPLLGVVGCFAAGDVIAAVRYKGQLVETVNGHPLAGAELALTGCDSEHSDASPGRSVLTDKTGRFVIETTYWGGSVAWFIIPIGGTKAPLIESVCFLVKDDDRRAVKAIRLPKAVDPNQAGTVDLGKIDIDFMHGQE